MTEEIYQTMYAAHKGYESVQVSPWPESEQAFADEEAEDRGDLIMALITEVRREKAEKRMSLNAQVKKLTVYAGDKETATIIMEGSEDIVGTCKVTSLEVLAEKGNGTQIAQFTDMHFIAEY